jgi:hypothetical protein
MTLYIDSTFEGDRMQGFFCLFRSFFLAINPASDRLPKTLFDGEKAGLTHDYINHPKFHINFMDFWLDSHIRPHYDEIRLEQS